MFLVGLTGGIAAGKSSVANLLRNMGIEVIDADLIAREVVEPGKKAWMQIRKHFGDEVFRPDGTLDRPELGRVIFPQPEKRKLLNSITHPEIYKSIALKCFRLFLSGNQFAVLDLPLLYESGKIVRYVHKVIVVSCEPAQQLERLMKRDSSSEVEALSRINAQMKLEDKCQLADYVVDNSRDEIYMKVQLEAIVEELRGSRMHWKIRFVIGGITVTFLSVVSLGIYKIITLF